MKHILRNTSSSFYGLICIVCLFYIGCSNDPPTCNLLPLHFGNYQEALDTISNVSWSYKDYCSKECADSEFINGMWYYSCDDNLGYLIIQMKAKKYIFKSFPKSIWRDFKNSESKGEYYQINIRDRFDYYLSVTNADN